MSAQGIDFAAVLPPQAEATSRNSGSAILTVLICDNALLRTGLRQILEGTTFVIAEPPVGPNPRFLLEPGQEPALIIMEAGQSSKQTVLETVRLAKESCPSARIVALADQADLSFVCRGIEAGLDGFGLTGSDREVLIKSLELVMLGETVLPSAIMRSVLGSMVESKLLDTKEGTGADIRSVDLSAHKLSAREAEVLACLMGGESNKIIARRLDVTEATIKVHVKAVLRKIGAANRTQAAIWATENLPVSAKATLNT